MEASAWFKILLPSSVILLEKWRVFSMSQPQLQNGFDVFWKLFLNLCLWRWLSPSRNLVKYLMPFRFWQLNVACGRSYTLKARSILNFTVQFIPFNDDWHKERIFEEAVFNFEMRNIISVSCINTWYKEYIHVDVRSIRVDFWNILV